MPAANGTPAPHPGPEAEAKEKPSEIATDDKDKSLEEHEELAFKKLGTRAAALKRPCASPQFAKPKAKHMKRPAAAKASASKATSSKDTKAGSMTKEALQAKMC